MHNVADAVRKLQRSAERSLNLYRLSGGRDPTASAIGQSLRAASKGMVSAEEQAWINRIEQLRIKLNASDRQITRTDYGAGSPGVTRTEEEMRTGVLVTDLLGHVSRVASKPPFWCLVLFKLIRTLQPSSCLEMGTAVGISAAYQAAALTLNGRGTLVSLEGASPLAEIARSNLQQLGLGTVDIVVGRFQDTLTDLLSQRQPVDYVFVDGHHDERATLSYFEQMLPFLAGTALLVFDDIAWSTGMERAWRAIADDRRIRLAIDLRQMGLCVVGSSVAQRRHFQIPLQ